MKSWWPTLFEHYQWQAALLTLICITVLTKIGNAIALRSPALEETRRINREADNEKLAKPKYPPVVRSLKKMGLWMGLLYFFLVLPWIVTLDSQPIWTTLLNIVLVVMLFDFFYYLTHRFLFHGNGRLRQVHALHHQARSPTYIDGFYVHPVEAFVGTALFLGATVLIALYVGPLHVATVVASYLLYVQVNTLNHIAIDIPRFPFRTLTWISTKHHIHHKDMHRGNFASITLLFDKIFGTLD